MEKVNGFNFYGNWKSADLLAGGSRARMAELRRSAAKLASNPHRNMDVAANPDWRSVRYSGLDSRFPLACPGFNGSDPILSSHYGPEALPIRGWQWADDARETYIRHSGWFTNEDCNETARGFVAMISHGRYLAGYEWSSNGEWVLFYGRTYSSAEDAARAADSEAESFAEMAREDSERFNAMTDAESEAEDAARALAGLYPGRNASEYLREQTREAIEHLREARTKREEATRAYEKGGN